MKRRATRLTIAHVGSTPLRRTLLVLLVVPATAALVLASFWHALVDAFCAFCRSYRYHFVPNGGLPELWRALAACWRGDHVVRKQEDSR